VSKKPTASAQSLESVAAKADAEAALDPVNSGLSSEEKIGLFRTMVRIRRFEERTLRVYQQGKVGGFLHLYIGQEAIAAGTTSLMGPDDHVITAYREHGHALAVGMTMNECMAEIQGKETGCSKGKGGSMHYFAPDRRFWGGHGIVGGQTPLGAGISFALKYQGKKGCCMAFMGDGAVNQGVFLETLNLASLWDLPVVFIIENNGYSMGTSLNRSSKGLPLAKRANGFDMEWHTVNGHSIYDVRAKTASAIRHAHEECRPTLLEMSTYRYRGHSMSDNEKYRDKDEVERYKQTSDPLNLFRARLVEEGVFDEARARQIDKEAREEAENSARFADQSAFPPAEDIFSDVYYENDHPEERASGGRLFFND